MTPIPSLLAPLDATAAVHALDLDTAAEFDYDASAPVIPASVFKLPVLVELYRQAAGGSVDLTSTRTVAGGSRTVGSTGISVLQDPITLSLRDLATLMMSISDNAATDVVCQAVALPSVAITLRTLGCTQTRIDVDSQGLFDTMAHDLAPLTITELDRVTDGQLSSLRALDPATSPMATTPRDMTRLLWAIWNSDGLEPSVTEPVRSTLAQQVWPHRLPAAFPKRASAPLAGRAAC